MILEDCKTSLRIFLVKANEKFAATADLGSEKQFTVTLYGSFYV
jgi:hypothetical protein